MPLKGQTITSKHFSLVPGGKGANKAYALGKLGANVSMFGCVGKDEYGIALLNNLNSVNVVTDNVIKLDNVNTGCAFINVDSTGENSIVVVAGANEKITRDDINNNISLIDKADIIVLQLEIPLDVVSYVAKLAKERGKLIILDPAPAVDNINEELLSCVDIIKPNETEIEVLTGMKINSKNDIINAAKVLNEKGVKNVIVTLGEEGSLLVTKDNVKSFSTYNVEAVDTTAAGDSFIAALAKSLLEGKSLDDAIRYGHLVSAIVVTRKGAQTSIPSLLEINEFLNDLEVI